MKVLIRSSLRKRRSPNYTLELSQKSNFQPSTTKPDNIDHPTAETGQIWPLGWFPMWFCISIKNKKSIRSEKSKLIYFESEKYETNSKLITPAQEGIG